MKSLAASRFDTARAGLFRQLLDNPHNAIRVRAYDHVLSCDKGRAAPVWPYKDGHFLGNNLAGHDHP